VDRHRRRERALDLRKLRIHDGRPEERVARSKENMAMNRPSSYKREFLTDEEIAKRSAPGRLAVKTAANTADRSAPWTPIHSGSAAAAAGQIEHELTRAEPELTARREKMGK
jgi:hypothetical protein